MQEFTFHRANSVADAVDAVKKLEEGKFLGGGQSLLPAMKLGLASVGGLVELARVKELSVIEVDANGLVIGAGVTHAEVAESPKVRQAIFGLAELAGNIGDPQVRNRGTLGGSIAHADPAADYPAALLALGAVIQTNAREISADDYFKGMFETALGEHELIKAVRFPIPDKCAYAKFGNPASKYAIVGVMVARKGAEVRVAVTGAALCVFRARAMEKALAQRFVPEALDGVDVGGADFVSDTLASADYRKHLVTVMAKRAVAACG